MSGEYITAMPLQKKPYVRISYYDYLMWIQLIDAEKLTRWELLRFKMMHERYAFGRTLLQVPVIGLSYLCGQFVMGPAIRRGEAGLREAMVFSTFFYLLIHHWVDQRQVPDKYLDQLLTQKSPQGDYIRAATKEEVPSLWQDFSDQLQDKKD
mmetsp:Transcript_3430/g.3166  ORF Transcript_3430/g.3166 Transcript_3430/m.3166 type:complete len:152 (+) Transcript_3430:47-502(+)